MSKRAVEKADKACPINKGSGIDRVMSMVNRKNGYIQGYMQAEKDIALTWEDIRTICLLTIGAEIVRDKPDLVDNVQEKLEQVFYEDVLRRFREIKKQISKEEEQ